jgi:outer membrane protein OmpA-like peptidoglycan-associated protein
MTRPALWPLAVLLAACTTTHPLQLDQVVLHRNGIGYFQHTGRVDGDRLRLRFRSHELDDVLKTLAIIDRTGARQPITVRLPQASQGEKPDERSEVELEVTLGASGSRDLRISYAVPTPAWKATYRLVLGESGEGSRGAAKGAAEPARSRAVLQGWAMVDNVSGQSWPRVALKLDTSTPLSYATDLRTPRFVARPDASSHLVQPLTVGVVTADRALPGDQDGDGIPDQDDLCPDQPEDKDGFEDQDGCPDPDNDQDRIPDAKDACPNEPETYNGFEDEDGCPDKGRVVVHMGRIEILDKVYFGPGAAQIRPISYPILDAIAATLKGNPQITRIEIQGHAADNEPAPWGVAAGRASSVRSYLVGKGVAGQRLQVGVYGPSRPVDTGSSEDARSKNRRVEFVILARSDSEQRPTAPAPASPARGGQRSSASAAEATVRYEVPGRIEISRGSSALVAIVNQPMTGEEVLIFRPDPGARGSDRYPFRAARLRNESGRGLVAGPMTIFSRGTFAGEGFLQRLNPAESAFIPFALDTATAVEVEHQSEQVPRRLVSLVDGVLTLEDQEVQITRYRISPGADACARIFLKHPRQAGYSIAAGELPPGSESVEGAWLLPIPIKPGTRSLLTVREQRPLRRTVSLLDESSARGVELYLQGTPLPGETSGKLKALLGLRQRLAAEEARASENRRQLEDLGQQSSELRSTLLTLAKSGGDAELRRKLLVRLKAAVDQAERLGRQLAGVTGAQLELRAQLREAVRQLKIEDR